MADSQYKSHVFYNGENDPVVSNTKLPQACEISRKNWEPICFLR